MVERLAACKWIFLDVGDTLMDETYSHVRWYNDTVKNIWEKHGKVCTVEECFVRQRESFDTAYCDILRRYDAMDCAIEYGNYKDMEDLFPKTEETLRLLSTRYKLGIIANQHAGTKERLDRAGIGKYISRIFSSAERKLEKPNPAFYQLALDAVAEEGVQPSECVMVGDRLDNDIRPAKMLGMKTVRVMQGYCTFQTVKDESYQPDVTVNVIADLPYLFL